MHLPIVGKTHRLRMVSPACLKRHVFPYCNISCDPSFKMILIQLIIEWLEGSSLDTRVAWSSNQHDNVPDGPMHSFMTPSSLLIWPLVIRFVSSILPVYLRCLDGDHAACLRAFLLSEPFHLSNHHIIDLFVSFPRVNLTQQKSRLAPVTIMDMDNMENMLRQGAGQAAGQFPLEQWFYEMPVCTRYWTTATVLTSLLVQCHIITPFQLFYSFRAVFVKNQVIIFKSSSPLILLESI